jgi:hypothetical protein
MQCARFTAPVLVNNYKEVGTKEGCKNGYIVNPLEHDAAKLSLYKAYTAYKKELLKSGRPNSKVPLTPTDFSLVFQYF